MITTKDALTGLCNRQDFLALLHEQVQQANESQTQLALAIIDINRFAQINATNSYAAGDAVLHHLAAKLRTVCRQRDYVARIGDNRFALLLPGILNRGHAELALQKLNRRLDEPFHSGDSRIDIRITAGVALCPEHATHAEYLLRKAEIALAQARDDGTSERFASDVSQGLELSDSWELEMQIDGAIQRGELQMHYQPQLRTSDLRVVGAEALMRWDRGDLGIVAPDVFIPVAERHGQIKQITIWALNTVLRQASEWSSDGHPFSVSVNLPGELASHRDLPELVENALRLWGQPHIQLVLEITERSLMDRHSSFSILQQVRALGVEISIDDFGTGYSCLAYFRNIPADELKIDKSFVTGLPADSGSADITQLIIDLAHRFGLRVVAEGVESAPALHLLKTRGCEIAQGFLLGRPMPPEAFRNWLDKYFASRPPKAEIATSI